jgi:hypothetical protein
MCDCVHIPVPYMYLPPPIFFLWRNTIAWWQSGEHWVIVHVSPTRMNDDKADLFGLDKKTTTKTGHLVAFNGWRTKSHRNHSKSQQSPHVTYPCLIFWQLPIRRIFIFFRFGFFFVSSKKSEDSHAFYTSFVTIFVLSNVTVQQLYIVEIQINDTPSIQ